MIKIIKKRRSQVKFLAKQPEKQLILQLLEAGSYAPAHKRTDPWRFVVFTGAGRGKLQQAIMQGIDDLQLPQEQQVLKRDKMQGKAYRAPVIIAVWCAAGRGKASPPVWEEHAATAACLQNMLLAAEELGLGAIWRSGSLCGYPAVQQLCVSGTDQFDAQAGDKIMGFMYLGYPDPSAPIPQRVPDGVAAKTLWLGD